MAHNDSFDEPRFEALYRKLYPDLLRCAEIALRTGGSWYVSVAGRAEEVVQELFAFAWEHQADLWSSASPTGWLYRVLRYKVLELQSWRLCSSRNSRPRTAVSRTWTTSWRLWR